MSLRTLVLLSSFFLLSLAFSACSATTTSSSSSSSDGGANEDVTAPTTDAGANATTPKAVCAALIACMADVAPESVGGLVSLYGEASNCWKGTEAEAEACKKACTKTLESRSECNTVPRDRHYATFCETGTGPEPGRYDVAMTFSPRTGGTATFRALPSQSTRYLASEASAAYPTVKLTVDGSRASGTTNEPFDIPIDGQGGRTARVSQLSLMDVRIEGNGFCSNIELTVTAPFNTKVGGPCLYLPLEDGATFPRITTSEIRNCSSYLKSGR